MEATEMAEQSLVRQQSSGLQQMLLACSTPSEASLVRELYVTAANAKTELDVHLNREFLKKFATQSPAAIEWAFSTWRDTSPFMPAICEIQKLLWQYHENLRMERATQEHQNMLQEAEQARARGEKMYGWAEIWAEIRKRLHIREKVDMEKWNSPEEVEKRRQRRELLTEQAQQVQNRQRGAV
jgi:hypothetical protein